MIATADILRLLYQTDPFPLMEPSLRTAISEMSGGRTVGNGELIEALQRLQTRRYVVKTLSDDGDPLWGLTPDGRTEAARRFR
jgi:DNA-binding PadR family transcriptional regulator